jgi:hypothetical protein
MSSSTENIAPAESAPFKAPASGGNRLKLYGAAAVLLAIIIGAQYLSNSSSPKKLLKSQEDVTAPSSPPDLSNVQATDEQVLEWQVKADTAIGFDDMAAAVFLLRKVVAARPNQLQARNQLARCQDRLRSKIAMYNENGAREFEKLYYDRAIREWRKVLALSTEFDRDTYKKTEQRIREAEAKLRQKP